MSTAFVLSGGCSLGAVQVGMLKALADRRVTPDLLVGTSAGALNATFLAGHGTGFRAVEELAKIWCGLRRRDLFPLSTFGVARSLTGLNGSVCSNRGLRQVIARNSPYPTLDESAIPVHVVATDLLSGQEVLLSEGDTESAVLASCAVPGILPAVTRDGRILVDGGLADNTAISQAVALGADRIYVLPSGYACARTSAPRTPIGYAIQALSLLTHQRTVADIALYADMVELIVLPPPCPLGVNPLDFTQANALIGRAYRESMKALSVDGGLRAHPEREIALHTHGKVRPVRRVPR